MCKNVYYIKKNPVTYVYLRKNLSSTGESVYANAYSQRKGVQTLTSKRTDVEIGIIQHWQNKELSEGKVDRFTWVPGNSRKQLLGIRGHQKDKTKRA